ncbi:MAG: GGDEF domain-containing protein [Ahniella sp.]|nr:GGDEF domain-containing protein [Ahniella sp.]
MSRTIRTLWMLLFWIAGNAAMAEDGSVALLRNGTDSMSPREATRYWVDADADSSISAAQGAFADGAFKPLPRWPATFGFADGVHWFQIDIENADHPDPDWLLVIEYALLDHLDLYTVLPNGRIEHFESGDRRPFSARAVDHRHFTFALDQPVGERRQYFLRVKTESSVQVPLTIGTRVHFLNHAQRGDMGLGLYYGVIIAMFLYSLLLYFSIRDKSFLWYITYVGAFGLGQSCLNGLSYQILMPEWPRLDDQFLLFTIGLALLAMLMFTREFLELAKRAPRLDAIMRVAIWIELAILVASFVLSYRHSISLETASVFAIAALCLVSACVVWRRGYRPAFHYLLAWSFMLLGIVIYASLSFGLVKKTFITEYGIQIGSCIEMILLSFALAYRFQLIREENEALQRDVAEKLEVRVNERTAELNHALGDLRVANRRLQEYSLRDGLTNVHNRRFLDEALPRAAAIAQQRQESLSLLIIDIDHFKRINDTHGHLAGDDCLRDVADVLRQQVREADDFVARYGGEEFVVILPGASLDTARQRAEALRKAVAQIRVPGYGDPLALTISVGVAALNPEATTNLTDDLLRRADQALYAAKEHGRNRVMVDGLAPLE